MGRAAFSTRIATMADVDDDLLVQTPSGGRHGGWARAMSRVVLLAMPMALAMAVYYPDQLGGAPWPRPRDDAAFYAYQLNRAAECHGQWWRIVEDDRLGGPYPTEFAKHPGLYEGVDLMLLAAITGGGLGAAALYHLAVLAALAVNGWVAAWIVLRFTRSTVWAAAAVALITLNQSIAARILGHLHLFKFGWILLAAWSFAAFLERPSRRRGLGLGAATALMLQASFYLGFLLMLGLGFWSVLEALAGRARRAHLAPAMAAALAYVVLAGALCFPVWARASEVVDSDQFFHHDWSEAWTYGAELWKYVVPRGSWLAVDYERNVRPRSTPMALDEGWNFPGYTVLIAVLIAWVGLLRGHGGTARGRPSRFVVVGLGLMAFWTIVSLSGGPSALLFPLAPSFRCYGRAGLFVVALGSVLSPIVLCELVRSRRRRWVRATLALVVFALAANDARLAARSFPGWGQAPEPPEWVAWLKGQPRDVRLAVFQSSPAAPFVWWGLHTLEWLPIHGHATLNGADFALFEGDLRLLGGSYDRINPAGLRLVASMGYEAMAFHRDYLAANPGIASVEGLDRVAERGEWLICRAGPRLPRLPRRSLDQLLAQGPAEHEPRKAPPGCWISGSWPLDEDVLATDSEGAALLWTDERGQAVTTPRPAFYQHVFGPSVPAYSIRTPERPGRYRLTVLDRRRRVRATIGYEIDPSLAVSQPSFPSRRPDVTVHPVVLPPGSIGPSGFIDVTMVNTSSRYLLAQVFREHLSFTSQTHPGLRSRWAKANAGAFVLRFAPIGRNSRGASIVEREVLLLLPADVPPGGRLRVAVPVDRLPASWKDFGVEVVPSFSRVGRREAAPESADIKISLERPSTIATGPRPMGQARAR